MTRTRPVSALIALLASLLLLTAVFAVSELSSEAQESQSCPAGSVRSDDGSTCIEQSDSAGDGVEENIVTTTSCLQGVLSDDGQHCIVPRLDAAPPAAPSAPASDAPVPAFTG